MFIGTFAVVRLSINGSLSLNNVDPPLDGVEAPEKPQVVRNDILQLRHLGVSLSRELAKNSSIHPR